MVIGGLNGSYLDDVELVSIDPELHPVPDCLSQLNPLPALTGASAGALDYSRKSVVRLSNFGKKARTWHGHDVHVKTIIDPSYYPRYLIQHTQTTQNF